jgi:hypothetical protein
MRNLEQSPVVVYLDDDDLAARMLERLARVAFLHLQKGTKRCTAFVEAAGPHLGDYLEDMAAIASLEPPRLEQPALVKASKAYWSDVGDVLHPFTQGATGVVLHIVKEYTGVFNLRLMQDKSLNVDDLSLGRWFDVFAEGGPPMGQRGIPSLHEIVPLARHEAHRLVTLAKLCHGRVVAVLKLAVQKKGAGCTTIEKLDTSIKGVDSLQRKITGKLTQEIVLDQIGRVVENEGSLVHDVLRFTLVVAKDECYAAVLQGVISIIGKSDGFEVLKILDLWNADISYRGINVVCRFVEMLFEVQFHTTASFGAVVDTHVLYEEARRSDTELQRREELSLLMKERWSVVQDPRKK